MAELQVIEEGLVPIYSGRDGHNLVDARELHFFLQSGWKWSEWIQDRIRRCDLIEGEEYFRENRKTPSGGRPALAIFLTLDAAKEVAMMENNDQGKRVRRYFIEVEKRARQLVTAFRIPQTFAEALRLAADQAEQIAIMQPKADFHDAVADATNLQGIARVAKMLDTGEIRFFRWLRAEGILMHDNIPYQEFLDAGYFKIKQRTFSKPNGDQQTATTTYVTGKGITWLQKRYAQAKQVTA